MRLFLVQGRCKPDFHLILQAPDGHHIHAILSAVGVLPHTDQYHQERGLAHPGSIYLTRQILQGICTIPNLVLTAQPYQLTYAVTSRLLFFSYTYSPYIIN